MISAWYLSGTQEILIIGNPPINEGIDIKLLFFILIKVTALRKFHLEVF